MGTSQISAKTDGLGILSRLNDLVQSLEGTTTDKQNIGGINLDQFLMWMFSSSLGRHTGYGTFHDL